jgi:polysaccharide export outer membrane protein
MARMTVRTFLICFLAVLFLCGTLKSHVAAAQSSNGSVPTGVTNPSTDQPDSPSRAPRPNDSYIIGDDDVLTISVWNEANISKDVTVRSDGKISLPLAGEVQATGRTPQGLSQDIAAKLQGFIHDPQVTVIVKQINSQKFNVLGQVVKPGSYPLTTGMTIVDAVATAGGFKDFAKKKSIYVLRPTPGHPDQRIPFDYEKFVKGKDAAQNIELKPRDTIVVP